MDAGSSRETLQAWLGTLAPEWTAGCPPRLFAAAFDAYASPGRHYHTWAHVLDCVEKLRTFPVDAPRTAFLALVFHDAVYVAGRSDNEERSAELARRQLRDGARIGPQDIEEIARMILATRSHAADPAETSDDLRAVIDIDMSILGAPPDEYRRYAEAIQREFCPAAASPPQFRLGRLAFLEGVLRQPRIYLTAEGAARWEAQARRNLAWEVGHLSLLVPGTS
jgi:predicted metal-dependent HD superfamily phosphohydrolase